MSWNYRVFHRKVSDSQGNMDDEFTIREAYYDDKGNIVNWSAEPAHPYGVSKIELMDDVAHMLQATTQPVVELTPDAGALA
jgi:hypothetical protein